MFIKIMLVLALMAGLCHLVDFLFGTSIKYMPSRMLGLKYENTSGDTYRGTLDQRTYTTWKNMKVVKRKVTTVANPQSVKQATIRVAFSNLAVSWAGLTEPQKSLWTTLGEHIPQPNPEAGVRAIIRRSTAQHSGINAYVGHNARIVQLGGIVTPTPIIGNGPPGVTGIGVLWTLPGDMTVSWVADPGATANDQARVWIVSRSTVGGIPLVHKQFLGFALATALTLVASDYSGALGQIIPFLDIAGAELYVQMDVVDSISGYFSVPSETIVTIVA